MDIYKNLAKSSLSAFVNSKSVPDGKGEGTEGLLEDSGQKTANQSITELLDHHYTRKAPSHQPHQPSSVVTDDSSAASEDDDGSFLGTDNSSEAAEDESEASAERERGPGPSPTDLQSESICGDTDNSSEAADDDDKSILFDSDNSSEADEDDMETSEAPLTQPLSHEKSGPRHRIVSSKRNGAAKVHSAPPSMVPNKEKPESNGSSQPTPVPPRHAKPVQVEPVNIVSQPSLLPKGASGGGQSNRTKTTGISRKENLSARPSTHKGLGRVFKGNVREGKTFSDVSAKLNGKKERYLESPHPRKAETNKREAPVRYMRRLFAKIVERRLTKHKLAYLHV